MFRVETLLPKQDDFLACTAREVLYSGAFGAGKSRAVCAKLVMRAMKPGSVEGLCRKTLSSLKKTTLRTLLEPDGKLPPVLPLGTYIHNKSEGTIRIKGGGMIQHFGMDDPAKIGSMNLSGCGVDEAVELCKDEWTAIRGRLRLDIDGLPRQLYGACNPGPPSHHLAIRFGLAPGARIVDGCACIQTQSADNCFLPGDYLRDINTYEGTALKRFVLGKWVASDRLVYSMWDRDRHQVDRPGLTRELASRCAIGVDQGFDHPAALVVGLEDFDGRVHLADEWVESGKIRDEFLEVCKGLNAKWLPERFVVPPEQAELIEHMRRAGLPVVAANNARVDGVQNVRNRLKVRGDNKPGLTVSPACSKIVMGFEIYETKDTTTGVEEYVKDGPGVDQMDATRYLCMYLGAVEPVGDKPWATPEADVEVTRDPEFAGLGTSDYARED